ncbi:MAG: periplasmic heavy metal sensor [Bacteroidetes bacterium]|nr:periplasmic heavy metal sensor [Bacteroidota bacterium]
MNASRNKILLAIIAVLLVSNIFMVMYFVVLKGNGKKPDRDRRHNSPMTEFLQKEIGFSAAQLARFDSLKQRHHAAIRPLGEDLSRSRDSLYQLIGKYSVSDSALQAAAHNIGRKQVALELKLFDNFRQIRAICTPEQLPRFDSLAPPMVRKIMIPSRRGSFQKKPDSTSLAH